MKLNSVAVKNKSVKKLKVMISEAILILSAGLLPACSKPAPDKDTRSGTQSDTCPSAMISDVIKTVNDNDAKGFASLCIYPISRPYPLRDIKDSIQMADYFPVMVDDSLRTAMKRQKAEDWESYGWRGWSFGDTTPIWTDEDGIEAVSYVSAAERGLQSILAREEMLTLAPEFREGWTPVMTLTDQNRTKLYRIDSKEGKMRLMGFDMPFRKGDKPSLVMIGTVSTEGSGGYDVYDFEAPDGEKAEYMPDAEPPVKIQFTSPSDKETDVEVYPAYWRDLTK